MSLFFRSRKQTVSSDTPQTLVINGREVPVAIRRNARARRLILRLNKTADGVIVTVPESAAEADAVRFARTQAGWIEKRLASRPNIVAFEDGAIIPLRGVRHRISHCPGRRGTVWTEPQVDAPAVLYVAGDQEHLARRLRDWLKRQARAELKDRCAHYADVMGLSFRRVDLRDQTSRWGSCSSSAVLSFSWRLILAPPHVLDYVAAHEVAHLKEMNHSPRFWCLVEEAFPKMKESRRWLKQHGAGLHFYGPK